MAVDRCVCHKITFASLKRIAEAENLEFEALRAKTHCCTACGLCEPYVRLMLTDGRTSFRVLTAQSPSTQSPRD